MRKFFFRTLSFTFLYALHLAMAGNVYAGDGNGGDGDGGSIKGHISTVDNKPAAAVTVSVRQSRKVVITDEDGNFVIRNIAAGHYEVEVSLVGYEPLVAKVIV